ncbi:MAG: hypothetical protein HYV28_00130 [Ignavibacteriales bacterium]|nr:hypothetical protein [Ignavibacteriales bacterium]
MITIIKNNLFRLKNRAVIIFIVSFLLIASLPFLYYRLPGGRIQIIESEIRYQMMDFGQLDATRSFFELYCGNKRLFLKSANNDQKWVYVSTVDFNKCWSIPPFKQRQDTSTFIAVLQVAPLFFNAGDTPAKLIALKRIHKMPIITK